MNKILSGLIGVFVVAALVGGAAYALFSSTATVTGFALSTGTAELVVKPDLAGFDFASTATLSGDLLNELLPGESDWGRFFLRNDSEASEIDPIDLNLTGQLTSYAGNWNALKDVVECEVRLESDDSSSGYFTLAAWNATPKALPGSPLAPAANDDDYEAYIIECMIDSSVGNEAAGKSVTDIEFEIVGEQDVSES